MDRCVLSWILLIAVTGNDDTSCILLVVISIRSATKIIDTLLSRNPGSLTLNIISIAINLSRMPGGGGVAHTYVQYRYVPR